MAATATTVARTPTVPANRSIRRVRDAVIKRNERSGRMSRCHWDFAPKHEAAEPLIRWRRITRAAQSRISRYPSGGPWIDVRVEIPPFPRLPAPCHVSSHRGQFFQPGRIASAGSEAQAVVRTAGSAQFENDQVTTAQEDRRVFELGSRHVSTLTHPKAADSKYRKSRQRA